MSEISKPNQPQTVIVKPKLGGFLFTYIIFGLPGFLSGIVIMFLLLALLAGTAAGISKGESQAGEEGKLTLTTLKKGKTKDGILIYDLTGAITSGNFDDGTGSEKSINTKKVAKDFDSIKNNPNIKNIVFRYNTPGGEIYASEILGDLITKLQKDKTTTKPNIYFDQLSASGGLWSSYKTGAYIMGSEYGTTGSIGVIMKIPNFKGIAEKIGYSQTVIKSSSSKDIGDPFRDMSQEEKDYLQKDLNSYYSKFKDIIVTNRKLTKEKVEELATGLTWNNIEAKEKGLIDEIGSIDTLVEKSAKEVYLADNYSIYKVESEPSFIQKILKGDIVKNYFQASSIPNPFLLRSGEIYAIDERRIN
jgi:protease IV